MIGGKGVLKRDTFFIVSFFLEKLYNIDGIGKDSAVILEFKTQHGVRKEKKWDFM